eukprot:CAMPEP_0184706742 /NCGR_PEP_ID=MMETSP0313-20130426/36915_1 /TAXON_ID=2792 /ORGANISM="Porphyridium aerugineum, Strain SAG 1380-2" /LENGTH=429 /DNA_ID=CAMNT_0027168303 /DNA_START=1117 /DNA_END=2409 /DNA_ORIENTATION=-
MTPSSSATSGTNGLLRTPTPNTACQTEPFQTQAQAQNQAQNQNQNQNTKTKATSLSAVLQTPRGLGISIMSAPWELATIDVMHPLHDEDAMMNNMLDTQDINPIVIEWVSNMMAMDSNPNDAAMVIQNDHDHDHDHTQENEFLFEDASLLDCFSSLDQTNLYSHLSSSDHSSDLSLMDEYEQESPCIQHQQLSELQEIEQGEGQRENEGVGQERQEEEEEEEEEEVASNDDAMSRSQSEFSSSTMSKLSSTSSLDGGVITTPSTKEQSPVQRYFNGGKKLGMVKRRKRYSVQNRIAAKNCHLCQRSVKTDSHAMVCGNLISGDCRKVFCSKCFETNHWDLAQAKALGTDWKCSHCNGACPSTAGCHAYTKSRTGSLVSGLHVNTNVSIVKNEEGKVQFQARNTSVTALNSSSSNLAAVKKFPPSYPSQS